MNRRRFSKTKFFSVLSITFLIFLCGILLGNYLSDLKLDSLVSLENDVRISIMSAELQYSIFSQDPCSNTGYSELNEEVYKLGRRLEFLETKYGTDDSNVLSLKEYYSLLEIRHWLLMNKMRDECDQKKTIILYFYSNLECDKCIEQGFILDYLNRKYSDIHIYSFDSDIDNTALNAIKKSYDVKIVPTLIIEGERFEKLQTVEEIEKIINVSLS